MKIFETYTVAMFAFFVALTSPTDSVSQTLNVICDEWPPYQIIDDNKVDGFSTNVVKTVFSRMGVDIGTIRVYPWKRAITMLENGTADALFSVNFEKSRSQFALYPKETIILSPWVMWSREEDRLKFDSLNDLIGKIVGMVRGYSYTPELWDFVKKHEIYEEASNDKQNFLKLNFGRIDVIPAELGNGLYLVNKLGLNTVEPLMRNPLKRDGLYIIFNKNNIDGSFVDKFSAELKKLKQEPIYKNLYDEYFTLVSQLPGK
ncbi:ABC transporter substrate-binding protein [Desulfopila sp. IMCC35008]|uniref:substrate-binding periplasmic protein n=1 Tax=Desulfopila sp. IMCC35008 TaxID=2653858 RepID=UPI0013D7A811|nr:transporter substrate-binding domain-containing protein [Desulfopila sp. IMCC35008]